MAPTDPENPKKDAEKSPETLPPHKLVEKLQADLTTMQKGHKTELAKKKKLVDGAYEKHKEEGHEYATSRERQLQGEHLDYRIQAHEQEVALLFKLLKALIATVNILEKKKEKTSKADTALIQRIDKAIEGYKGMGQDSFKRLDEIENFYTEQTIHSQFAPRSSESLLINLQAEFNIQRKADLMLRMHVLQQAVTDVKKETNEDRKKLLSGIKDAQTNILNDREILHREEEDEIKKHAPGYFKSLFYDFSSSDVLPETIEQKSEYINQSALNLGTRFDRLLRSSYIATNSAHIRDDTKQVAQLRTHLNTLTKHYHHTKRVVDTMLAAYRSLNSEAVSKTTKLATERDELKKKLDAKKKEKGFDPTSKEFKALEETTEAKVKEINKKLAKLKKATVEREKVIKEYGHAPDAKLAEGEKRVDGRLKQWDNQMKSLKQYVESLEDKKAKTEKESEK